MFIQASSAVGRCVTLSRRKRGGLLVGVFKANIAEETTDVVVNTVTEDMNLAATDVSKAIAHKAGPKFRRECKQVVDDGETLQNGRIIMMNASGALRCKRIIHAYVPARQATDYANTDSFKLIESLVTCCLQRVERDGFKSVTFPAFGLGYGGYKTAEVAGPMFSAIKRFGQTSTSSLKMVRIAINSQDIYDEFYGMFIAAFIGDASVTMPQATVGSKLWRGNASRNNYIELNPISQPLPAQAATPSPLWAPSRSVQSSNPVAVFQIYAASENICAEIEKELRGEVSDRAITKIIKGEELFEGSAITEDDNDEIRKIEDCFGVEVKLIAQLKEIHISGERNKVMEALEKIMGIKNEIEKVQSQLKLYQWQSCIEDQCFEAYPHDVSMKLERAYQSKLSGVEVDIDGENAFIDLKKMEEVNKTSSIKRFVKRCKIHFNPNG